MNQSNSTNSSFLNLNDTIQEIKKLDYEQKKVKFRKDIKNFETYFRMEMKNQDALNKDELINLKKCIESNRRGFYSVFTNDNKSKEDFKNIEKDMNTSYNRLLIAIDTYLRNQNRKSKPEETSKINKSSIFQPISSISNVPRPISDIDPVNFTFFGSDDSLHQPYHTIPVMTGTDQFIF